MFLFLRSILQLCNKLAVGWEWMNVSFMLNNMAFLYQSNSHHNELNYYYRISFSFFCSDFAAYIRWTTVSYGFYDKIFMLSAASNRGRHILGGELFLFHDLKIILLFFWFIAVFFVEIIFSVTLYVNWYVIILFMWTMLGPCHLFHSPRYTLLGNFLRDKI